ncbi:unnamed protein product [Caenorhabditis auriculariae]|uniref:Uncharacterized protein n=1 Tax=Caenorhabditis auriculariae TaxID=2777116 RepID=A0A8S1HAQ1_9PELO|nr:unnamed protein product [Caenorhabditis auriculariae]
MGNCCSKKIATIDRPVAVLITLISTLCLLFFASMFLPITGMIATQLGVLLMYVFTAAAVNKHPALVFPAIGMALIMLFPASLITHFTFQVVITYENRHDDKESWNVYPYTMYEYSKTLLITGLITGILSIFCLLTLAVTLCLLRFHHKTVEKKHRLSKIWIFESIRTPHDQKSYIVDKNHGRNPIDAVEFDAFYKEAKKRGSITYSLNEP